MTVTTLSKSRKQMRRIPELLAPAGSFESLRAAVKGGADAVYFGGRVANARNSAKNFSDGEISLAVDFLHDNGKYAYITLNTLHTDRELSGLSELSELLKFAEHCYISGADAFIVQDVGLSGILKYYFPDIKLHASTQAAGHNLCSAKKLAELGFSRMVIARETSGENLKYLTDKSNDIIEIEMFIHGALCSSHSGRCFLSFAFGNTRSANSGMCAQPCRLRYNGNYNGGYTLSLKDLCLAGHIEEIIKLSPASLKIEGRMKPPEYVYNVCKVYRACLDENRNATKQEIDFLAKIFSRQGFTDGYFTGNTGANMYGVRTEENKTESKIYSIPQDKKTPQNNQKSRVFSVRTKPEKPPFQISNAKNIKINPKLCLVFNSCEQFYKVADYIKTDEIFKRIYKIFLPLCEKVPQEFIKLSGIILPYVIYDNEREAVVKSVKNSGVSSVLIDNIGHIDIAKELNLEMFGNMGLNVTNSYALEEYKKTGFTDIILSPELNFPQIRDIKKPVNCGITAYGRTCVMISENCIIKNNGVCKVNPLNSNKSCVFTDNFYLTDRTDAKFFIRGDFGHRNIIYNSVPVYLADKKDLYKNLGLFFVTLNFTDENPAQIKKIISDYALNKDNIKPPEKFTRGYNKLGNK